MLTASISLLGKLINIIQFFQPAFVEDQAIFWVRELLTSMTLKSRQRLVLEEFIRRTWVPVDLRGRLWPWKTHHHSCLWNEHPATYSHTRKHFKDVALREKSAIRAIWTVHMTEPCEGLCINFSDSDGQMQRFPCLTAAQVKPQMSIALPIETTTYQPGRVCLFLPSLPTLTVQEQVSPGFTRNSWGDELTTWDK